jgi:hypothetical protein
MAASPGCTIQWVVAGSPSRMPAAARISAPGQTDVVHRVVSCTRRSQSSSCLSAIAVAGRGPEPGTSTTSGVGVSA